MLPNLFFPPVLLSVTCYLTMCIYCIGLNACLNSQLFHFATAFKSHLNFESHFSASEAVGQSTP